MDIFAAEKVDRTTTCSREVLRLHGLMQYPCTDHQVPVSWERVSVAPVRQPDGKVTVPDEVIHSMERNKIGLKGELRETTLG